MEIKDVLFKRCLIKEKVQWGQTNVTEIKVLEISPSGKWVKIMNIYGNKYWKGIDDVQIIEVLFDLKTGKPKD